MKGARGRAGRDGTGSISLVNGGRGWREWNNGSEVKPVPAAQPAAAPLHGGVGLVSGGVGPGGRALNLKSRARHGSACARKVDAKPKANERGVVGVPSYQSLKCSSPH